MQLSKNVKQMKFMQKKYGEANAAEEEKALRSKVDEDHWVLDLPELDVKESRFEIEDSFVPFENLQFGRLSFKGMNPVIEKLMANRKAEKESAESDAREKELAVSDEEMAARYSSLIGTIGKKFVNKRNRTGHVEEGNLKKMKFMKPPDDDD